MKTSGPWVFAESKAGAFHKVIALGTGELDAIEEYWVDDNQVTLDANGWVNEHPWNYQGKWKHLRIQFRTGLSTETHYNSLTSVFLSGMPHIGAMAFPRSMPFNWHRNRVRSWSGFQTSPTRSTAWLRALRRWSIRLPGPWRGRTMPLP